MADVALHMPEDVVDDFQKHLPGMSPSKIVKEAMSLYAWYVNQRHQGRTMISCNPDGSDMVALKFL